nr:unnamed protein product [Leishmania braziliensis]
MSKTSSEEYPVDCASENEQSEPEVEEDLPQQTAAVNADEEDAYEENVNDECPSEEEKESGTMPATPAAPAAETGWRASASYADYMAAKEELQAARAAHERHVREITCGTMLNGDMNSLMSVEELTAERVRLAELVRHHKDEQDSLALDIEGLTGAGDVYQLAARVQRLEHFVKCASQYVNDTLPQTIETMVKEDRRQSNQELCDYIQDLQEKRADMLKKIAASQEIMNKRKQRQKAHVVAAVKQKDEDPMTAKAEEHTHENKEEYVALQQKIRKLCSMRTKLQSDIMKEKKSSKKMEERMLARIRNLELDNARDARMCKELNNRNAAFTTNSQLLIDQLNVEHYGIGNAPTTKKLMEERKQREALLEWSPPDQPNWNDVSGNSAESHQSNTNSGGSPQRAAKPPLVAMKMTKSQRARDDAVRMEREEYSQSRRRSSDAASYQSSRHSISRPPLAAWKRTASQQSRESAIRESRRDASVSRTFASSNSEASDASPGSASGRIANLQSNNGWK